jgi:hypothetical protein
MYKRRKNNHEFDVNLDPLMDVLTCTIGVMLVVVIFTVIEARGTGIKLITPLQTTDTPKEKNRVLFICKDGKIKPLNMNLAYSSLNIPELSFFNMSEKIAEANQKNIQDEYFKYSFEMGENNLNLAHERWPIIRISEKESGGDDVKQIKSSRSEIRRLISGINRDSEWIAFAVCDQESIDVFREARNIANESGISNGWDPVKMEFPASISLNFSEENHSIMFIPQQ